MYSHLFHLHPAYEHNACGGSVHVHGKSGGSQGLLQNCGDIRTAPGKFNTSLPGPEGASQLRHRFGPILTVISALCRPTRHPCDTLYLVLMLNPTL